MSTGVLSSGVNRPEREANHSPPFSAESENAWSYISTPLYTCMDWCFVKHQVQRYTYLRS
jgi:hypothetical protein